MRVPLMVVLLAASSIGCASTGATPRPFPRPGPPAERPAAARPGGVAGPARTLPVRAGGYEISGTALSLRGTPYRSGGTDTRGFDCSGLVWYVFAQHGLALPRTVVEQYRVGGEVQPADLQAGDLVFFNTGGSDASHVGISVGGDSFVHAPTSAGVVRVERLGTPYWASRFVGARRVN